MQCPDHYLEPWPTKDAALYVTFSQKLQEASFSNARQAMILGIVVTFFCFM